MCQLPFKSCLWLCWAAPAFLAALSWQVATPQTQVPRDQLPATLSIDRIPLGLDPNRPIPKDNPLTEARVQLGRKLFFDPLLSRTGTLACASCHDPAHAFAGRDPIAVGIEGKTGRAMHPRFSIALMHPISFGMAARIRSKLRRSSQSKTRWKWAIASPRFCAA